MDKAEFEKARKIKKMRDELARWKDDLKFLSTAKIFGVVCITGDKSQPNELFTICHHVEPQIMRILIDHSQYEIANMESELSNLIAGDPDVH